VLTEPAAHRGRTLQTVTVAQPGASAKAAPQPHPTTRLGDLTSFATITGDLQALIAENDMTGGKARVKDLEVAWDDAEAGLKPATRRRSATRRDPVAGRPGRTP
jgi:hypothetical protein